MAFLQWIDGRGVALASDLNEMWLSHCLLDFLSNDSSGYHNAPYYRCV